MYVLVGTSIDLAFVVSTVSRFMSRVGSPHWMAVKCITRYMKGTLDFKLCLGGNDIVFKGFCDANWVGDANNWRSTMGYVFFVGVEVIS